MIEEGFIKDNNRSWYYEFYRIDPEISSIVLLHEGLGSVAQWKSWPKILQDNLKMNVLVYDRTGYGKSSQAPDNYPFDYLRHEAKEVFPKILNHLNINSAHLFGHSDGGTIALLAAAYHPDMVQSVISEAAHVIIEEISINGIKDTYRLYENKLKSALKKYHKDKTDWVFHHWADTWLKPEFFEWNMIMELQKISCPVLAIQGKNDNYGSYEQLKIIEENCHSELLYLDNCAHHPHFEQTDIVVVEISQFLKPL